MRTTMGSSNKSRKHYKKDSRFVTDLYTFTYDDFDLVRMRERAPRKEEGRQCTPLCDSKNDDTLFASYVDRESGVRRNKIETHPTIYDRNN